MNSMNKLLNDLKNNFSILNEEFPMTKQLAIDVKNNEVLGILSHLKANGFKQLSLITCVDWLDEELFQLTYIVFNWNNGIHIQVRTNIDRNTPVFKTITTIYPGAEYYERDVHEFFGIKFDGNKRSEKQLFLEMWDELPPLRKDFDPLEYSNKTFPQMEYDKSFVHKVGGIDNERS